MPTYLNSTSADLYSADPFILFPADSEVTSSVYARGLPSGVTLTDHSPAISPWVLLVSSSTFPTEAVSVSAYKSLIIHNECSKSISIEANEDTSNAIRFGPNSQSTIENNPPLIGSIIIDTDGSGDVYVWGIK